MLIKQAGPIHLELIQVNEFIKEKIIIKRLFFCWNSKKDVPFVFIFKQCPILSQPIFIFRE